MALAGLQPIDPSNWTDDGSTYVELHGGPAPTFWGAITLNPNQTLEWTETWLPLRDIPVLSMATPDRGQGSRRTEPTSTWVPCWPGAGPTLTYGCGTRRIATLLWSQEGLSLAPGEAYTAHLAGIGMGADEVVLGVLEGGSLLAISGDLTCPAPSSQVDALGTVQTTTDFTVQWSAADPEACWPATTSRCATATPKPCGPTG